MSGKELADAMSKFVNSFNPDSKTFVEAVTNDHKTLQQSTMRLFMKCIERWAEMRDEGSFDRRNEDTCRISKEIMTKVENKSLPMI